MKKILVISDNPRLVAFFRAECKAQDICGTQQIDYKYSSSNKNPASLIELGLKPVDLKDSATVEALKYTYSLIFSLHCKQIFPAELVSSLTCINIHPGLNPHNRGWYPQVFSILNKQPIGATIHLMDAEVDHGKILDQFEVKINESDTSLDVYERVYEAEKKLINRSLRNLISGEYTRIDPHSEGNYNSIQDFKSLCNLNLEATGTLREHIDLLRALSHGDFKNAYFLSSKGKRIFISVSLKEEEG